MQTVQEQAKKMAIQFIRNEARNKTLTWHNRSLNMDHERKVYFVHNPKCMGTSLKNWLGLCTDDADHRFPTLVANKSLWETYTTVVVLRHPLDRFVSSYHYHCKSDYAGGYLIKYPDLKSWDMDTYFEKMRSTEPYCVAPQWKYTVHLNSERPPDFLLRIEDPVPELKRLAEHLGIQTAVPVLNQNRVLKRPPSRDLRAKLEDYYALDFQLFGY